MKKVINGKVYDTNTATQIAYWESGSKTSPSWYEEMLFRKRNGELFIFGHGYAASPYAQRYPDGNLGAGSVIRPVSWEDAKLWAEDKLDDVDFDKLFGEGDDSRVTTTISFSRKTHATAQRNALRLGISASAYIELLIKNGITETVNPLYRENGEDYCVYTYEHFMPEERAVILQSAARFGMTVIEENGKIIVKGKYEDIPSATNTEARR